MSSDDETFTAPKREETWGQRHGLTVMLAVMGFMFVLVIVVQMLT